MQEEYTYIAVFVLLGVLVLLTCLRLIRATGNTIGQLRYESERDRYQKRRIAEEKYKGFAALDKSSRRLDARAARNQWDGAAKRAHREFHLDVAEDEVFNASSEYRGMDIRTPWGWPSSATAKGSMPTGRRVKPVRKSGIRKSVSDFFKPKTVIDTEYRERQKRAMRTLVEDRYGRASHITPASEIEWSSPQLPPELVRERETARIYANKVSQDEQYGALQPGTLRLVSNEPGLIVENRRVSGE